MYVCIYVEERRKKCMRLCSRSDNENVTILRKEEEKKRKREREKKRERALSLWMLGWDV